MARKKKRGNPLDDGARQRLELRVSQCVGARLRELANETGISINQLCDGILRWAVKNAYVGEPHPDNSAAPIETADEPGVIWFGFDGYVENEPVGNGYIAFVLDYSGRHAVRDGIEYVKGWGNEGD